MTQTNPIFEITLTFHTESDALFLANALDEQILFSSWEPYDSCWILKIYVHESNASNTTLAIQLIATAHNIHIINLSTSLLKQNNWLYANQCELDTFEIGPFYIYGTHSSPAHFSTQIPIKLDSTAAFGSGNHGTTQGCLKMLSDLRDKGFVPNRVFDLGTGSGILAIAAQKLWPASTVMASDLDPESIRTATWNAQENNTPHIHFLCANGVNSQGLKTNLQFGLVTANLLSNLLINLSAELIPLLAPKGYLILSGILSEQKQRIIHHYTSQNLHLISSQHSDDWHTLLLQK